MDTYSPDEIYTTIVEELFVARNKGRATGGRRNIRAKGDYPEQAVRKLISSLVGRSYRVTQGHVVRADGKKSGQMDIIIVKDVPAATMYKADDGETELVRVEWVAAVGEVKASWWDHGEVIRSYRRMVEEMETLKKDLLVANKLRFGTISDETTIQEMARPVTGREWNNPCYTFLIALEQGKCKVKRLEDDMRRNGIRPSNASVLILDEKQAATLCIPAKMGMGAKEVEMGIAADINMDSEDAAKSISWITVQIECAPIVSCAKFLHYFVTDLQLHLGTWHSEYINARHYAKIGPSLRHRHAREKMRN